MSRLQFSVYPNHRIPYDLPALKPLKPPVYNPYDKFSQPEFDAWIGDLTDALKGALGRLDDVGQQPASDIGLTSVFTDDTAQEADDDDSVDNELEDSFADIMARRVISKGKARDPREGPGFGTALGARHQPIEIGSDSEQPEEGEEGEEESQKWDMEEEEEEGEEEAEEKEDESDEEEDESWLQGETSIQARIRSEGDGISHLYGYEDGDDNDDEYDQDEEDDVEHHAVARSRDRKLVEDIILLSSDEELEGDEDAHRQGFEEVDELDGHSDPETNEAGDVDPEDAQPEDEDSLFASQQPVEIPDPWSGPKTYAEDFYSGGDVRVASDGQISVDHLSVCDIEDSLSTSQPISPTGKDTLLGADVEELSGVNFDQPEEHEADKQIVEDDAFKSYSPSPASPRDAQRIDMSELYGDMEVDVHEHHREEPSKATELSTVEAHHTSQLLDNVAFDKTPHEMQAQEATEVEPPESRSHLVVEERLDVEAVEMKEPVADVVENVALLATHIVFGTTESPVADQGVEGMKFPSPIEPSEESLVGRPQPLPHISGGLPTPELDLVPYTTFDKEQTASCLGSSNELKLEATHHFLTESSMVIPGARTVTDSMASVDEVDVCAMSTPDTERQGDVASPDDLLKDTDQSSAGIHHEFSSVRGPEMTSERDSLQEPRLPSQALATINDLLVNYTILDSSSPSEMLQSDIHVTVPATTIPVGGYSQESTVYKEPSLDNEVSDAALEQTNDFIAPSMVTDVTDRLPAPAPPVPGQADVTVGLTSTSNVLEKRQASQSRADQASDEASRLPETDLASAIEVTNDLVICSGDVNGRFGHGEDGNTTDTREVSRPSAHDPAPLSSAYTSSHSAPYDPYSLGMVMPKATDPVLFIDPYPYSLSTPRQPQDEASDDEGTEQENSLSSASTFDKYSDDKGGGAINVSNENAQHKDDATFQSPSEVDNSGSAVTVQLTESMESSVPKQKGVGSDTDADGDVDPEFIKVDPTPSLTHLSSANGVVEDPFRDRDAKSSANQGEGKGVQQREVKRHDEGAVKQQNSSAADYARSHVATSTTAPPMSRSFSELPAILIIKRKPTPVQEMKDDGNVEAGQSASVSQLPDTPTSASRSVKRKRDMAQDALLTRPASSKKPEKSKVVRQATRGPMKGFHAREPQPVKPHGRSVGKGKDKTSQSGSRNTSRASSIVSSTPSDKSSQSMYMHPSPTVDKGVRPQMPPPLLHTHLRTISHHHGLPYTVPQIQHQRSVQKSNSMPRQSDSRQTAISPSSHSGPSQRSSSFSGSPVTRSHCRYHKISMPRYEDDGPREYFLVPGCSLGNRELIAEELIEDHGDATPEDADRSVNDIVSLIGLNPYLVGIMRQLVGLDRDQEVYYVPSNEQELVRKSRSYKYVTSGSPRISIGSARSPTSSKAPLSTGGSVSTSASFPRKETKCDPLSALSSTESDLSNEDESPRVKRARPSLTEDKVPVGTMGLQGFDGHKMPSKRDTKKRMYSTEALGEPDVQHPKLKKQKTHTIDETVGNIVIPPSGSTQL